MKTLSIVIPVYNENASVEVLLTKVFDQKLLGWKKEIVIIDDGSTDGTDKKLQAWEKRARVIYQKTNSGKGSAIAKGLSHVTGDIVLIQDADLEYSPGDYQHLLRPFENERVEVVYGSRFLGGHLSTMFVYELGNKFVTFMTNVLYNTNITDMETGYKCFRKHVLKGITIKSKRFDFEPEITAKVLKNGHQIYEVPISYYGRMFSEGKKLTWKDGIAAVGALVWYRFFN